jgi:hypothetical protein
MGSGRGSATTSIDLAVAIGDIAFFDVPLRDPVITEQNVIGVLAFQMFLHASRKHVDIIIVIVKRWHGREFHFGKKLLL